MAAGHGNVVGMYNSRYRDTGAGAIVVIVKGVLPVINLLSGFVCPDSRPTASRHSAYHVGIGRNMGCFKMSASGYLTAAVSKEPEFRRQESGIFQKPSVKSKQRYGQLPPFVKQANKRIRGDSYAGYEGLQYCRRWEAKLCKNSQLNNLIEGKGDIHDNLNFNWKIAKGGGDSSVHNDGTPTWVRTPQARAKLFKLVKSLTMSNGAKCGSSSSSSSHGSGQSGASAAKFVWTGNPNDYIGKAMAQAKELAAKKEARNGAQMRGRGKGKRRGRGKGKRHQRELGESLELEDALNEQDLASVGYAKKAFKSVGKFAKKGVSAVGKVAKRGLKGPVISFATKMLKKWLPKRLPFPSGESMPVHPLIKPTINKIWDGNIQDAVRYVINGLVQPEYKRAIQPLLEGVVIGALQKDSKKQMKGLKTFAGRLMGRSCPNIEDCVKTRETATAALYSMWIAVLKMNPCGLECTCREFLGVIFNRKYVMTFEAVADEEVKGDKLPKQLCPNTGKVPCKSWPHPMHQFHKVQGTELIWANKLGDAVIGSKNADEYARAVHRVFRDAANSGDWSCTRKHQPERANEKDRDCVLGTVVPVRYLTRRLAQDQRPAFRKGFPSDGNGVTPDGKLPIACRMGVYYRLEVCQGCCCPEMARVIMNTELRTSKPGNECQTWFMIWDSLLRAVFNGPKGMYIKERMNTGKCKLD